MTTMKNGTGGLDGWAMGTLRALGLGLCMTAGGEAWGQLSVLAATVNTTNSKTYLLLEQSNWTQARARALELGGHLATIRSAAENTFVYNTYSMFGNQNRNLWIGYYDLNPLVNSTNRATRRAEFGWESGEASAYANWSPVEPNNPSSPEPTTWEYYVHIWQPGDANRGTWNNLQDGRAVFGVPLHGVVEACAYGAISPAEVVSCPDNVAQFQVAVTGVGPFAYRWQMEAGGTWANVDNGWTPGLGVVSGAQSTELQVSGFETKRARVRCIVTNACGSVPTGGATLTVCACLACPADFNEDGGIDGTDATAFFDTWEAGNCDADVNQDGGVDGEDVTMFFGAWETGGC